MVVMVPPLRPAAARAMKASRNAPIAADSRAAASPTAASLACKSSPASRAQAAASASRGTPWASAAASWPTLSFTASADFLLSLPSRTLRRLPSGEANWTVRLPRPSVLRLAIR